jgi:predicted Zn-dependent protease
LRAEPGRDQPSRRGSKNRGASRVKPVGAFLSSEILWLREKSRQDGIALRAASCIYPAVSSLEPRDKFALESASGWLMLGNAAEALHELNHLSASAKDHPEVLMLLWEIHARARRWIEAIETADGLIAQIPEQSEGYIKRAYALHELKRTQEAWDTLEPVSQRFAENWLIPYNLACYACQLGHAPEAVKLLKKALRLGNAREIRAMALEDDDLQPLRDAIEKLPSS